MDLLEHGSRKGPVGTGNRASDSVRRLVPQCDFRALPLQLTIEPIGSGPDLTLTQLEHQMTVAPAVETENQLNEVRGKQRTQASDLLPKFHERWGGDMAPGQVEDLVRPVVRMQSDTPAPCGHVERQLGPVIVGLFRRHDGRIRDIPLPDPPERVPDESTAALQLGLVVQMLKLTAAAVISGVVRTARLDPSRRGLEHRPQSSPGKFLMLSNASDLDEIAWRRPRNKERPAILQLPHSIASSRQP
jgi:hypothetical protein